MEILLPLEPLKMIVALQAKFLIVLHVQVLGLPVGFPQVILREGKPCKVLVQHPLIAISEQILALSSIGKQLLLASRRLLFIPGEVVHVAWPAPVQPAVSEARAVYLAVTLLA